jgi:hypothetical protein
MSKRGWKYHQYAKRRWDLRSPTVGSPAMLRQSRAHGSYPSQAVDIKRRASLWRGYQLRGYWQYSWTGAHLYHRTFPLWGVASYSLLMDGAWGLSKPQTLENGLTSYKWMVVWIHEHKGKWSTSNIYALQQACGESVGWFPKRIRECMMP